MVDKKIVNLFFVVALTLLALFLHIYHLTSHPPFDVDEYSIGYNAYSIAQTGMDEWGMKFPLFFRAFGDYKLPIDIYSVAILFKIFGAHDILLRLPAAFIGALYVPLTYFLLKLLVKKDKLVWLGTILSVFSPFNVFFSRIISGSITQSFLTFASLVAFAYFLTSKKYIFFLLSLVSITFSLYAYPSAWIVAPILVITYMAILFYQKQYKFLIYFGVFFVFLIPIMWQFYLGGSEIRLAQNTFMGSGRGPVIAINDFRQHTQNDLLSKVFHNKITYYSYTFALNYLKHFDPQFLIFPNENRIIQHSLYPLLFTALLPFYYLGIFFLFKNYKNPLYLTLLVWILISPLPSAITEGAVNTKRYLSFLGSEVIISMIGLYSTKIFQSKKIYSGIVILLFIQVVQLIYFFFIQYPPDAVNYTHFKGNILANMVKNNYNSTDLFVYTPDSLGEPQIFPLFASRYPPTTYIKEKKFTYTGWYYIKPFDKFYYSENINDIRNMVLKNKDKRVMALLLGSDLITVRQDLCYKTIREYRNKTPQLFEDALIEVVFIPCT